MKKEKKETEILLEKKFAEPGAVEDIQELQFHERPLKSGAIGGTENQINTAGATSSTPEDRK